MSGPGHVPAGARQAPTPPEPRGPDPRAWARDLALGARLALAGGAAARARVTLTTIGVGLGVALLLAAAATPSVITDRAARSDHRTLRALEPGTAPATTTAQVTSLQAHVDGRTVSGLVVWPDGGDPPVPPGLRALPGPGEMVVSPALYRLLTGPDGARARARLPYRAVGLISRPGLVSPGEFYAYVGGPGPRAPVGTTRISGFGTPAPRDPMPGMLTMLVVVIVVVLLMPIGAFLAAAARFGSQARDRQLAALRLLGADPGMARRTAAGGALVAALGGLAVGVALFAALRPLAARLTVAGGGIFSSDVAPRPELAALVVAAVPGCAVVFTLLALRRVTIEPLGVLRRATPVRRRLAWRLVTPAVGVALLWPMRAGGDLSPLAQARLATGVVLVLAGVVALLPWVVEAAVRRLGGGPPSWLLAVRRLQLDASTTTRAVAAVSVAAAGAIALQSVFTVAERRFTHSAAPGAAAVEVTSSLPGAGAAALDRALAAVQDTRTAWAYAAGEAVSVEPAGGDPASGPLAAGVVVADCATLRLFARLAACADGDVFLSTAAAEPGGPAVVVVPGPEVASAETGRLAARGAHLVPGPGTRVRVTGGHARGASPEWVIPAGASAVAAVPLSRHGYLGPPPNAVLATPGAVPATLLATFQVRGYAAAGDPAPSFEEFRERAELAAARVDPLALAFGEGGTTVYPVFRQIRAALDAGVVLVLVMVGASLLVTVAEQLRERRRVLAVLAAFGARRRALAGSVLWQAALPMALGLVVAVAAGTGLGSVLLRMVGQPPAVDWSQVILVCAAAAGAVLATTAAALPVLWRLTRPDGLRSE